MNEGSHMVGGRTYRNIVTTNEQKPTGMIEPQKLKIITTSIIPEVPKVILPIVGTDLNKMITTHDEPKTDLVEVKIGEPIPLDEPEPKKKASKPKKAEQKP